MITCSINVFVSFGYKYIVEDLSGLKLTSWLFLVISNNLTAYFFNSFSTGSVTPTTVASLSNSWKSFSSIKSKSRSSISIKPKTTKRRLNTKIKAVSLYEESLSELYKTAANSSAE